MKPRRADDATRIILVGVSRILEWRHLLIAAQPETLIRWHERDSSCCGVGDRTRVAAHQFQQTCSKSIATMAAADLTWGEERITAAPRQLDSRVAAD